MIFVLVAGSSVEILDKVEGAFGPHRAHFELVGSAFDLIARYRSNRYDFVVVADRLSDASGVTLAYYLQAFHYREDARLIGFDIRESVPEGTFDLLVETAEDLADAIPPLLAEMGGGTKRLPDVCETQYGI